MTLKIKPLEIKCKLWIIGWENSFEEFIKIILNKPNSEEIFTLFYTLYYAIPYLYKKFLIDNLDTFKNDIITFINNLDTKEIYLPKDLIEMLIKFLKRINKILKLYETKESEKVNLKKLKLKIRIIKFLKMKIKKM